MILPGTVRHIGDDVECTLELILCLDRPTCGAHELDSVVGLSDTKLTIRAQRRGTDDRSGIDWLPARSAVQRQVARQGNIELPVAVALRGGNRGRRIVRNSRVLRR